MKSYSLLLVCLITLTTSFALPPSPLVPIELKCELQKDPLGIDVSNPDMSFILSSAGSNERGLSQTAYEILVASSVQTLNTNKGDLWSSGKVLSDKMAYIKYEGKELRSSQKCWWKVRVWDKKGNISAWSSAASWTMGIIHEEDWKASWLSAADADKFSSTPFGYRTMVANQQGDNKWVQVDLGQKFLINKIGITPVFFEDRAGYAFPPNFKIEGSNDPSFATSFVIADHTSGTFSNPGWKTAYFPVAGNTSFRYVRLTCTKLARSGGNNFLFALRQVEVFANGKNIAAGKKVDASDSNDEGGWSKQNLTDGPLDWSALPNYSSMLLRKEFEVKKSLSRAVIHVSGMSEYELTVNGKKTGDYLLTPGWTEYRKTVLYDTYDITQQLKAGGNAIGIIVGNGMYNIQPDSVRYVKFLNSFGPLKAIAQLRLEYTDGSVMIVGTDASWQVSPGPVTYSNMFGGEDYDANLETAGWNKAGFKTDKRWSAALVTTGPGGKLKGLSSSAPPVKVIQVIKPAKITKLKNNILIYDFGQNASMMPRINVSGPKGAYVRMIPSELLGTDGYVDRKSATQDGVRPAWWQYTLAGTGNESWQPKFFYQGARYLQVELYPGTTNGSLPAIQLIEDQVVHSSSTPIGKFTSSNTLFNRTYELVRWAQRSNMMSLMTDCPHREKMGWLEENHLNGPALRYNFDMALLFRKTMSDMADAQLENGFVPNIAPEYFIAGRADLSNAMRNSPEWGSSFIIVPWQQYLFSGDISLLDRYYDRMKRYVAFLASTANNNIIPVGLGDWYDIGPKEPWGSQLTPPPVTGTAIYYYDTWILSRVAELLGKKDDAIAFQKAANEIKESFNKEFYKADSGYYATNSQTANAMTLFLNLVEPQNREKVLSAIVADIRQRGNSLTSGDVGYRFLLKALAGEGRSDVIYDINNQSEKPGYGYQLKMGATSLTEKWDAGVGNFGSQNHFMLGQINEWFFHDLVGISSDENGVGFRKIMIKPSVTGDISWVKGSFNSISGPVVSEWKRNGERFELNVSIPPNTNGIVYVPSVSQSGINENGRSVLNNTAIKFIKMEKGYAIFEIGSGHYQFSSIIK